MADCHQRCVQLLKDFVEQVEPRGFLRALDVAGGNGRLATSEIFRRYARVDLFDQCSQAVTEAQSAMARMKNTGFVSRATMQKFAWTFFYSAIFMV